MLDLQPSQQFGKAPGFAGRAVVGHHPLSLHTRRLVVAQCRQQVLAGALGRLIGRHEAETHARMLIDGHVQRLPAGAGCVAGSTACHPMAGLIKTCKLFGIQAQ